MRTLIAVAAFVAAACIPSWADTYHVLPDGTGDFPTIQAGIDASFPGDTILLANGVFTGDGNRDIDYGGKAITVRSESDDPDSCILDCQGGSSEPHRGFRFHSGETGSSILRGITVTNGYATGYFPHRDGAGIYCEGISWMIPTSPTITNCVFTENAAQSGGGAFCYDGASPTFVNCVFSHNQASARTIGAGMYCYEGSPVLLGCEFIENAPDGLYGHAYSSPHLEDCSFSGHASWGAGLAGGCPSIENCRFFDNGGIGLLIQESSVTITGCSFWNNQAADGAALYLDWDYDGSVIDCLFYNNTALQSGGAVWCGTGTPSFINCTMAYNQAGSGAGGIDCGSATVTLENCIIAFSTAGEALAGSADLACCDLYGNAGGDWIGAIAGQLGVDGNISEDPLFCNPPAGDFTVPEDSPCAPFSPPNPECALIGSEPATCDPSGLGRPEWLNDRAGPLFLHAQPNPATAGVTLHLSRALPGNARLEVFDAAGRLIWRHRSAGRSVSSFHWRGCDQRGVAVPAGIYHLRVVDGGRQVDGRVVIVR